MLHVLEQRQFVGRPRSEVFAFFSRPENLEQLTPDFLRFKLLTPSPVPMREGALIDYRITLGGIPMRWRTQIAEYRPEERFVDIQLKGPYEKWEHTHEFVEVDGGTEIRDRVEYVVGFGPLGEVARALFVGRTLERIFEHRRQVIARKFR
jgi:ligand-binding SRPBCC domain-containing protein